MSEVLKFENINFNYSPEGFALRDLNFSVNEGDFISVIGRNGSGKSTLVKLIIGLLKNYSGIIYYRNKNIIEYTRKDFAQRISYLPQSGARIESGLEVYDVLQMGRYSYKSMFDFVYTAEDNRIVDESLKLTEIEHLKHKSLNELSGGEKQKILLTMCLVQLDITKELGGKILIIDEPLTYLDVHFQLETFSLLNKLNKNQNLTILMITHDLNFALKFTGKTLLLDNGELKSYDLSGKVITEEVLKKYFLIDSKIHNLENELYINYKVT